MLNDKFLIAGGSTQGRDHARSRKNNQDSFHVLRGEKQIIGIVTDGCGDLNSKYSEAGAQIGARLLAHIISRSSRKHLTSFHNENFWEKVRQDFLSELRVLANQMGDSLTEVISNYFLFTVIGFLITESESIFFSIGDGILFINGHKIQIGPFPNNEPPYLAYALLDSSSVNVNRDLLKFSIQGYLFTKDLHSFLIGCDGVSYLVDAEGKKIPGRDEVVEPISDLWSNTKNYSNPLTLSRKLTVLAKDETAIDWDEQVLKGEPGLLIDDTTLIMGFRVNP